MSSNIYFKNNNLPILKYLIRFTSETYRYFYPSGAERQIRHLLTNPQKRTPAAIPDDISSQSVATQYGELMTYSIGSGPTILFVHGWSGSGSQFFNLMRYTAKRGYRAVSYDHYKHGHSSGKECNYPLFVHSLEILGDYLYNTKSLFGVVSHSIGACAALDFFKESSAAHFLIAPSFNFYEELEKRIEKVGISSALFEKIVRSVEDEYKVSIKNHDSIRDINLIKGPINIIHSQSDKYAPYHLSKTLADTNKNITLHTVDNIGHMRIVNMPQTTKALTIFLRKKSKSPLIVA